MTLDTYILLLISHFLGDVVFGSHKLSLLKRDPRFPQRLLGVGGHCGIHALVAGIILGLAHRPWLYGALLVLGIHFLIDFARSGVEMRLFGTGRIHVKRSELIAWISGKTRNPDKMKIRNLWPWVMINFLDQGSHVVSLYFIAEVLDTF